MWLKSGISLFLMPRRLAQPVLSASIGLALIVALITPADGQTFSILHNFSGGGDGASPDAGLTIDSRGNFYGTTEQGGANGYGTVFMLTHNGSNWTLVSLYSFAGGDDGASPGARIIVGSNGTLYGTTSNGGGNGCGGTGCGTVFNLTPPTNASTNAMNSWTEVTLHHFTGASDGALPTGNLVLDQAGDIYGTTVGGGASGRGVVYELMPSNGNWTETVLWSFTGGADGGQPMGGVIFDTAGNLYGTTQGGGANGFGLVFQLVPAGPGWSQRALYSFHNGEDGGNPKGGVTLDSSGNLYGTTSSKGQGSGGTVFELTPQHNGTWAFTILYALPGQVGGGPQASLTMDGSGNLYGTTYQGGASGYGSVFGLMAFNGSWSYTDFHDFSSGSDGAKPIGELALDANGNLYGTASAAGEFGYGIVFEITPLSIVTRSLPSGTVSSPYSTTLSASGGTMPYTWAVISGALPGGLTLNASSGLISGTPTTVGTFNFTVQVTDSESPPATANAPLSITIQAQLSITTSSLPAGTVNVPYSATLSATGGQPPYTWSVTSGVLPTGLTLNASSGVVSGTPTSAGNFNFTVQVSDSASPSDTATAQLSITVTSHSVVLSWDPSSSQDVIGYNAYRATISGGPYSKLNSNLIPITRFIDQAVQDGNTYYYVTTAVNSEGMESVYSNQAAATVP